MYYNIIIIIIIINVKSGPQVQELKWNGYGMIEWA